MSYCTQRRPENSCTFVIHKHGGISLIFWLALQIRKYMNTWQVSRRDHSGYAKRFRRLKCMVNMTMLSCIVRFEQTRLDQLIQMKDTPDILHLYKLTIYDSDDQQKPPRIHSKMNPVIYEDLPTHLHIQSGLLFLITRLADRYANMRRLTGVSVFWGWRAEIKWWK